MNTLKKIGIALGIVLLVALLFLIQRRPEKNTDSTATTKGASSEEIAVTQETATPRVRFVDGAVYVQREQTLITAGVGLRLQNGDLIQTGPTSTVDILWPYTGHTVVGNGSVLHIDLADVKKDSARINLKLVAGRVWSRIQKLLEADSDFTVFTESGVSSIVRGTSYGMYMLPNSVQLRVQEGKVLARVEIAGTARETTVMTGQEISIPIGVGSEQRPLPSPRTLADDVRDDPIFQQGDPAVPSDELNDPTGPGEPPLRDGVRIEGIIFQSRVIPLDEVFVFSDAEAGCTGPHYHAVSRSVTAIDGTVLADPGGCGYGLTRETPVVTFEIR